MGLLDLFSSQDPSSQISDGNGVPSIGGIQADFLNFENIISGKAKSSDYGAGAGAIAGSFFGAPQLGADIGRKAFPIIGDVISGIGDAISK